MADSILIEKGADRTFEVIVFEGDGHGKAVTVKATAGVAAAQTSIPIERLSAALADGDMLMIGESLVVTVDGTHAIGIETLTVEALPFAIRNGDQMRKLQNVNGYTCEMQVLRDGKDTTPVIAASALPVTIPSQSATTGRGRVQVAYGAADTSAIQETTYVGYLWRRDSGNNRKLWAGEVKVVAEWSPS